MVFSEVASGAKADRPQLTEALKFVRGGDVFVAWRLDRVARSLTQLLGTIESLQARNVGFKSICENLDTTSAGGMLCLHVFAALSQFERSLLRERTIAGLEAARSRGRVGGRPKALNDVDVTAALAMLSDQSLSIADVAKRLNVSTSTIYRYLPPGGRSAIGATQSTLQPTAEVR